MPTFCMPFIFVRNHLILNKRSKPHLLWLTQANCHNKRREAQSLPSFGYIINRLVSLLTFLFFVAARV